MHRQHVVPAALPREEKIRDAAPLVTRLPREVKPRQLAVGVRLENDKIVALAVARKIPIHRFRLQPAEFDHMLLPGTKTFFDVRVQELVELPRRHLLRPAVLPLQHEQRAFVDVAKDLPQIKVLFPQNPHAPKRRLRDIYCRRQIRRNILSAGFRSAIFPLRARDAVTQTDLSRLQRKFGRFGMPGQLIHDPKAAESILTVKNGPGGVRPPEIVFHITTVKRGPSANHRNRYSPARELLQILFHHHGRLHQKSGESDRVRPVFLNRLQNALHRLLDPEVKDTVAVVGENDIDQILADVVHIAAHGSQHHRPFLRSFAALHELLQITHRGLHRLSRLQHERELQTPAPEQLADNFHPFQKDLVDDL